MMDFREAGGGGGGFPGEIHKGGAIMGRAFP